jgi:hypothetical protein
MNISTELYEVLVRQSNDTETLLDLWLATTYDEKDTKLSPEIATFEYRREVFLGVLERLLKEGRIKLFKNDIELTGSPCELVDLFSKAWPESVAASGYDDFYWWFLDDECPVGNVIWISNE